MSASPNDYVVLGVETTGLADDDLVWATNRLRIVNGHIVESETNLPDWSRYPDVIQPAWLQARLAAAAQVAVQRGRAVPTLAKLQRFGQDPRDLLHAYRDWLWQLTGVGTLVVGHNLLRFDWPVLRRHVRDWLEDELPDLKNFWDVGLAKKASSANLLIWPQETSLQFFERVADHIASVRWSLDFCLDNLGLTVGVDRQHPLFRVLAIHAIYQCQRMLYSRQAASPRE